MLLNKEIFNNKSKLDKLITTFKTLTPEKSFYFYIASAVAILLTVVTVNSFIKTNLTSITPKYNQELSLHSSEKIKSYLPLFAESMTEKTISKMLFSGLLKYDGESYANDLASSTIISDDGLTIDITLGDNMFSNASKITADDVLFTYKLMQSFEIDNKDRAKYEGLTLEKIDDKNVRITLKKSYSQIKKLLTLGIISKEAYQNEKLETLATSEKNLNPISSGIYGIYNYTITDGNITSLTMKSNKYHVDLPYTEYIKFYFDKLDTSNDKTTYNYLLDNNIDISLDSSINTLTSEGYKKEYYTSSVTKVIFMNPNKSEVLSKKINREYLYRNIDRYYVAGTLLGGLATTTYDVMPTSKSLVDDIQPSLSDTSFMNATTTLKLTFLNTDNNKKLYSYMRDIFAKSNINIEDDSVTQDELQDIIKNRDFELLLTNIDIEDVSSLYSFMHSSQKNAPGLNITNYVSKNFDKNIETMRSSIVKSEIDDALLNMRNEFYIEYPYIPLYSKNNKLTVQNDVNIEIETYLSTDNNTFNKISYAHKDKEYQYNFLQKYKNIIIKINKIIH